MTGGLSAQRLARLPAVLQAHIDRGEAPGLVALVSRRGETHVFPLGKTAVGGDAPMTRDTIFRIASMTKPVTAVAAMILVEECRLRLDDPVDDWLPELADRKVLKRLDGPLDDTTPAHRAITLRDLLTFRFGHGFLVEAKPDWPISRALVEKGLAPGPNLSEAKGPDDWIARLGSLPLADQPGEVWRYHTGSDVLGVLIARASGQTFESFLSERVFEPLGMKDTDFSVPADKLARLPPCYQPDAGGGSARLFDEGGGASRWARPPAFAQGGAGLVSTADDFLAFAKMMLAGGRHGRTRILSRPTVELMTTNHLTDAQRAGAGIFMGEGGGWGFGMAVTVRRHNLADNVGRFGWEGGYGTSWHSDPNEDLTGVLLTQWLFGSPAPPVILNDFWTCAYQAIDD
jgi:CubicO group peptidase (beta-lactamase class C family)